MCLCPLIDKMCIILIPKNSIHREYPIAFPSASTALPAAVSRASSFISCKLLGHFLSVRPSLDTYLYFKISPQPLNVIFPMPL